MKFFNQIKKVLLIWVGSLCLLFFNLIVNAATNTPDIKNYSFEVQHLPPQKVKITVNFATLPVNQYTIVKQSFPIRLFGSKDKTTTWDGNSFFISGAGIYQISIEDTQNVTIWEQLIYIPYSKPSNHYSLAKKYLPITAYADKEEFFPQRIDEILHIGEDINSMKIEIPNFTGISDGVKMGTELITFMKTKGNLNFILDFPNDSFSLFSPLEYASEKKPFLESESATRPVTAYYSVVLDKDDSNKLYITYHYIYAFDVKLGSKDVAVTGNHVFDRESVTLTLTRSGNTAEWKPESVTYGAHLDSQSLEFYGCNNFISCDHKGAKITSWGSGSKLQIEWSKVPKLGHHMVIYPAQGSHAVFPTYGQYGIPSLISNELAGNISDKYTLYPNDYELFELDYMIDTEEENQTALVFSGFWVDGFSAIANSRFPPFIRDPHNWLQDTKKAFNIGCDATCKATYFPTSVLGTKKHAALTGRITGLTPGKRAVITFNDNRYYITTTDKSGYFDIIIPWYEPVGNTINYFNDSLVIGEEGAEKGHIYALKGKPIRSGETLDLGDIDFKTLPNNTFLFICHE